MQVAQSEKNIPEIAKARISILQAKWYREYTDKMFDKCKALLLEAGALEPERHIIPGSLELPVAAQTVARLNRPDAIICFGAILKGDTYHFDIVLQGCTQGLNRVSLDENIPIIIEVLPVTSIEQLEKRSADDGFNKGIEAAFAAAEIISWRRGIRASPGSSGFKKF